jgi:DNA-binding transcriptional ArsR family regulator
MHTYMHTHIAIDSEDIDVEPICILSWEKAGVLSLPSPTRLRRRTFKYLTTFRSDETTINNKISKYLAFVIVNNMAIIVMRDRLKHAILTALADKEMVKILESATFRPTSVNEVIRDTGISHSTAYRKIKWMLEEGLLFTEKISITDDGKKFSLFRSTLRSIVTKYDQGKMTVQVEYNIDVVERTAERLFSLSSD